MKIVVCKGCLNKMMAVDKEGKPACVVCHGFPDSGIPMEIDFPEIATCESCGKKHKVNENLPFLRLSKPHKKVHPDSDKIHAHYYCGCKGWE